MNRTEPSQLRRSHSKWWRIGIAAVVLMVTAGGCVYFNTFYNAKQHFKRAERENKPSPGRRGVSTSRRLYEDAISKARKIVDKHPNSKYHDDALFMIGVSYFRMTEYTRAERSFRQILATHPESNLVEESKLYLARCRMELGDEQAGFRSFTELAETAEKSEWRAEAVFQRGEYFADHGAPDSAVAAYSRVLVEFPNSDRALESRLWAGEQLRLMDRPLEAISFYEPLLDDEEVSIRYEALLGTGEALYESGDYDSGIALFKIMTEEEDYYDSIGTIRLVLARGLENIDDIPAAMRQYQQITAILERTSWSAEAYFHMAEIKQFIEADLVTAREYYDACRQEFSRGELANLALARSAYIGKLEQFQTALGRAGISTGDGSASGVYNPADLPAIEREITFSPINARPRSTDFSALFYGPSPHGELLEFIHGPPTPAASELASAEAARDSADTEIEQLGPPTDLAPTLGPPVDRSDIAFNSIRNVLLSAEDWWSLLGRDSLLGPASPAYAYPFGSGNLLGPPTPSDSALEYWAELEASSPARLLRQTRVEARAARRTKHENIESAASTQMQLAELYRFNLAYPDSAIREYEDLVEQYPETPFAAQALLAAADTYTDDLGDSLRARERLVRILTEYPYTDYAGDAIARLGWKGTDADTAHPAWAYAKAEEALFGDDNPREAIDRLEAFIHDYPQSRLIPTAEFAVATLTEQYFAQGDSSVIWAYGDLVAEYPGSEFALAAQEKLKTTVTRPQRRRPPVVQQPEETLAQADSVAQADTTQQERLPLAPRPKQIGLFSFPDVLAGTDIRPHVVVYAILINFSGEIDQHDLLMPSPEYEINEATRIALDQTTFWADSIAPDSLNMWYRYEMTITPPAQRLDEFDRLGIDRHNPRDSEIRP